MASPTGQGGSDHQIAGGIITAGGGVPLYKDGKIIGGLGISGDTPCTDHEIAKRVRELADMNPTGGSRAGAPTSRPQRRPKVHYQPSHPAGRSRNWYRVFRQR
ncbi:MAG: hypothetical protein FJ147_21210 [Deltaproteobacteria bacterium]|nr:hypothetical protein [Deltaproteobacteria bacterium]